MYVCMCVCVCVVCLRVHVYVYLYVDNGDMTIMFRILGTVGFLTLKHMATFMITSRT